MPAFPFERAVVATEVALTFEKLRRVQDAPHHDRELPFPPPPTPPPPPPMLMFEDRELPRAAGIMWWSISW